MAERKDRSISALPVSLDEHRLIDTGQMATATRYSAEHLRRLVRAGKFPRPVKIGRRFLWPASVLVDLGRGAQGRDERASADRDASVQARHDDDEVSHGT